MAGQQAGGRRLAVLCLALLAAGSLLFAATLGSGGRHGTANAGPRRSSASAGAGGPCAAGPLLVPPCGVWWGAYVPEGGNGLAASVDDLEQRIGRRLDIVYNYHDMSTGQDGQLLTPDEQALGRSHLLMLSWASVVWQGGPGGSGRRLAWRDIAAGRYDTTVIDPQIKRIKAYGAPVLLSFDEEMDSLVGPGRTPADYVAAYRHLWQRFHDLGADHVVWVWTITGYLGSDALFPALYPGDSYVGWIAFDPYNYFGCHRISTWSDFEQTVRPGYAWLRAHVSASKPMMLAEYGTAVDPAHPAAQRTWFEQIPAALRTMPDIKAVVQWDSSVPGPDCDLSLDNPEALGGFRAAGRNPMFQQPLPGISPRAVG